MYNFIDVDKASDDSVLPSEAMKLNGEYLENLIDGYRTLHVSGREALSPELETYETGVRDGSKLKSRRYPARTIIITYQLIAESNEAFRRAYNKLGGLLNLEDAKLIFNDEPDKFFIGTPSFVGEVEPGANSVIGEFEILCTDPLKYSVVEYEASPPTGESSIFLNYNGTYKAYPTFKVDFYKESEVSDDGTTTGNLTGNGDCGFVAFYNEKAKMIQIGDPNEIDGSDEYKKSQTLIHQIFEKNTTFSGAAAAPWTLNAGVVLEGMVQTGTVGIGAAPDTGSSAGWNHLTATDFGTAPGEYHGPSITRTIPADQSGVSGAANFTLTYLQNMCMGNGDDAVYQIGGFQVCLLDSSDTVVAGVRIIKHVYGSNVASLRFFINGKKVHDTDIDLTYYNEYFGASESSVKTSSIIKGGNAIEFKIGGYSKVFVFKDDAIQNVEVRKITFAFETYGSNNPLSYNGLTSVKFVKNNCSTWKEVPNKFSANDILEADCKNGRIYLNRVYSPELGALGNNWESFYLKPGLNQIGIAYSDWVSDDFAPTFKVRYREAFL